jgi:hypothetical protein
MVIIQLFDNLPDTQFFILLNLCDPKKINE